MITMKLTGAEKLLARIEKVKNEKSLYRLMTREGSKIVKSQVENDLPKLTGFLASNVKVRALGKRKIIGNKIVVGTPGRPTFYGMFIDHGTKPRYTKSGRYSGQLTAKRYVFGATAKVEQRAIDTMIDIGKSRVWS